MNKLATLTAVAVALLLTGCSAAANEPEAGAAKFAASADELEATSEPTPAETADSVDLTAAGEVCDPQSDDDFPCLVADPDLGVIKMTSAGRAGEPLISMSEADRIALAHEACDALAAGSTSETVSLIDTDDPNRPDTANNFAVFSAGAAAYCPEFAEQWVQDELAAAQAG